MNKKTLFVILALVLAVALLLGIYFLTRPATDDGSKTFTLTVVHGDGTSKDFTYTTQEEFVGTVLLAEGVITGYEGPYGLYMETVDGEEAIYEESGAYWAFYVGEEYAMQGIELTPIQDGATYRLVYTTE